MLEKIINNAVIATKNQILRPIEFRFGSFGDVFKSQVVLQNQTTVEVWLLNPYREQHLGNQITYSGVRVVVWKVVDKGSLIEFRLEDKQDITNITNTLIKELKRLSMSVDGYTLTYIPGFGVELDGSKQPNPNFADAMLVEFDLKITKTNCKNYGINL